MPEPSGAAPPDLAHGVGIVGQIFRNLSKLVGGKAAAGLISLAYIAIAARALGPRDYGVLMLVHGFAMTIGGIIGFPGWHAVVRYGAEALAAENRSRLVRLLRLTAVAEGAGAVVAIVAAAVLGPLLGPKLGWSREAIALSVPYSLAVLASMRSVPAGYLQLSARFDLLGAHTTIAPLTRLAGAVIVTWLHAGLTGFLVAWLVAALAEWAGMWLLGLTVARRRLAGAKLLGRADGAVAENPGIWRFMIAANADVTFSELAGRIAPLAVGWVLGPAAAGLFAVAQRSTTVIAQPASILGQAAYAELARLVAGGAPGSAIRNAIARCAGVAAAVALPIVLLIAVFGRQIATLIGGHSFAGAADVMLWLAASRAILMVGPPISAALIALGRPGLSVTANMLSGLGLLVVLPPLMMRFGLEGAGIHAVLQALAAAGLLIWFVSRASRDHTAQRMPAPA